MIQDTQKQDGFQVLLQSQQQPELPDFMESNIMASIEALPTKAPLGFSLSTVFVIGSLCSLFLLLSVLSSYYYPQLLILHDIKSMILLSILVKLLYDLNLFIPALLERLPFFKKNKAPLGGF